MADRGTSLRDTLRRFERRFARTPAALGSVAVQVRRRERFTNVALTPAKHRIALDEPAAFGGTGRAPDPAEHLLAAVGASLSVTLTAHAALRGLALDDVHLALSAFIDGKEFFQPGSGGRAGVLDVQIELTLTSAEPLTALRRLLRDALRAAPVVRSLKRLPRVTLRHVAVPPN